MHAYKEEHKQIEPIGSNPEDTPQPKTPSNFNNDDAPKSDNVILISAMNPENQLVAEYSSKNPFKLPSSTIVESAPSDDQEQEQHPSLKKEPKKLVLGPYLYPNGATYIGNYDKGLRQGRGKQIWKDGSCYEGEWYEDAAYGFGRLIHAEGDCFEGNWVRDKTHGFGVYTHADGTTYEGDWENDVQNGKGKETWPDKSHFEGNYVNGLKNGYGEFFWKDGSFYKGEF